MSGRYIVPLDLGSAIMDKSLFYLRKYEGQKTEVKTIASYIGGATKKIVVDTGIPDIERSLKYHPYYKPEPLTPSQELEGALEKAGVTPDEIDIVILTHLHWDHVGGVGKFPNAKFIVSREELRFAIDPPPCLFIAYEALQIGIEPMFLKVIDRVKTVDMKEKEICEGVKIIPLPGHTPGSIGVVVETDDGPYVIAGDAADTYQNLQGDPENKLPFLMQGIYTDMEKMWKSFEFIDEIVKGDYSKVIPGHDPQVFKHERYPIVS